MTPALSFITLRWLDVLDILIVAFLIYQAYYLIRGTVAIRIFIGIITVLVIWRVVEALQMELVANILGQFIGIGAIAVIIIFQPELRNFLTKLGSSRLFQSYTGLRAFNWFTMPVDEQVRSDLSRELTAAVTRLSASRTGALIVVEQQNDLTPQIETGKRLQAHVSADLLESLFIKNSPLHDGAVILRGNRIQAAGCLLPVSQRQDLPAPFGLRHRAALGISAQSDALALVVSEESGAIHLVQRNAYESYPVDQLEEALTTRL